MEQKQTTTQDNNKDQIDGNEDKAKTKYIAEGVTYKSSHGGEYRLKHAKPMDQVEWKKRKRISTTIALGIMTLLTATFLLKCTAVSPLVYGTEEKKKIILEEMDKRYGQEFEITKCDWGGTLLGSTADMIGVKLKNSSGNRRYGIFGYIVEGKYTVHDNYFAEAVIKEDYEAVIREILDKELSEYKIRMIDFKGYNNYVDYCTKETKISEIYDLGMKYGPRDEDGITLFHPYFFIDVPDSITKEKDMKAVITDFMEQLATNKLILSGNFHVVKNDAYLTRGTDSSPYVGDDLEGVYLTRIEKDLTVVVDNYHKY